LLRWTTAKVGPRLEYTRCTRGRGVLRPGSSRFWQLVHGRLAVASRRFHTLALHPLRLPSPPSALAICSYLQQNKWPTPSRGAAAAAVGPSVRRCAPCGRRQSDFAVSACHLCGNRALDSPAHKDGRVCSRQVPIVRCGRWQASLALECGRWRLHSDSPAAADYLIKNRKSNSYFCVTVYKRLRRRRITRAANQKGSTKPQCT